MTELTTELETKLAFLEDTVETLNQALSQMQQDQIHLLREMERLQTRLKEVQDNLPQTDGNPEPPPPHY